MMNKETNTARIDLTVPPSLKEAFAKVAHAQDRSTAWLIRYLMAEAVKKAEAEGAVE